jgi:epoxyqueuosine reductase
VPPHADAAARIRARALELGFDAVGIARIEPLEATAHYEAWIAAGRQGEMRWLEKRKARERRAHPERILKNVRSIVCVALCHPPSRDATRDRRLGRIARYAAGEDYHRIMRDKLRVLDLEIEAMLPGSRALWYADTGAILERAWGGRAGIGWTGKHSGLLSRSLGSWFLIGELLVDRELEPDLAPGTEPAEFCGTCTRCIDVCPTHAIVAPYQVDARLCISYLTIEFRGVIPRALRASIGDWIFGCDLCQDVCPWNRFAPKSREARLHARELDGWTLEKFLTLDEDAFAALFEHSPVRRAGRAAFVRNACVALGNRGEASAVPALTRALEADRDAIVRAHAAWALGAIAARLGAESAECSVAEIRTRLERVARDDDDETVREESAAAFRSI